MEATLAALGQILLKAVPTFVLVLLLYAYLTRMFFRPLERELDKRYRATEGARKLAEETLARAEAKAEEYEAAVRVARGEVYHENDRLRRELQAERSAAVEQGRRDAEAQVASAKADLEKQVAELKETLGAHSDVMASQIANLILRRRTA